MLPDAPDLGAQELAAEMAEIFAMSLIAECHLSDLDNPHCVVQIDPATRFNLHELLCELRSLPWCDARTPAKDLGDLPATDDMDEAGHRRAARWNNESQLTLGTLFRSGVALTSGAAPLSGLFATDHAVGPAQGPLPAPVSAAPLSLWSRWCAVHSGAGLGLPGRGASNADITTLSELAEHVFKAPPARAFHSATLASLAHGSPFDPGLNGLTGKAEGWTGGRLFALLAEAESRARWAALRRLARADRLSRPAVTAARMTVHLAREEQQSDAAEARYRGAADELALSAPNLLNWVSRANKAARSRQRFEHSLFLPLGTAAETMHPSDTATHVVVAGALATLMKAVFDTSQPRHLRLASKADARMDLGQELDRLVANTALARVVTGAYFPAENHQDMRLGQAIALQVLRTAMEEDNRSASLTFRDFDGRILQLVSHPRQFGRGIAELRQGDVSLPWPQEATPPAAHLTAVV